LTITKAGKIFKHAIAVKTVPVFSLLNGVLPYLSNLLQKPGKANQFDIVGIFIQCAEWSSYWHGWGV